MTAAAGSTGTRKGPLLAALEAIESATSYTTLFPNLDDAKSTYRRLAQIVHPDRVNGSGSEDEGGRGGVSTDRIQRAFAKLSDYYAQRTGATTRTPRIGDWTVHGGLAKGGLCDVYQVTGRDEEAVLKVARLPRDNPLLSQEAAVLKSLHSDGKGVSATFRRYLPRYLDALNVSGRRANVVTRASDCYTLDYIASQFPTGVPFVHVVWMGNRLLEILGAVHRVGTLHGAILPHHLMYRPSGHGLVLVDWTSSTTADKGKIPILHKRWKAHYPKEVGGSTGSATYLPSTATDIYMAAEALRFAAGGSTGSRPPRPFRAVLEWMTAESPVARPLDAWEVQDRWRAAAEEVYGESKFVELSLPNN